MIILSKVLKESNQIKILAIRVAAKRTLDNALLLIRESGYQVPAFAETCTSLESNMLCIRQSMQGFQHLRYPPVLFDT